MKKTFLAVAAIAFVSAAGVRDAKATDFLHFRGGPMKNLYVDLIFWGNNFSSGDRQFVRDTVTDIANWLNGGTTPPIGMEPTIHYYGLSGIVPGAWIDDKRTTPPSSGQLDDISFQPHVADAQSGLLGPSFDWNSNVASSSGLPVGSNRLALVITKGTANYCISLHRASGCAQASGYHDVRSGNPYGAVMLEANDPVLSHEILEAMSDPYLFNGWVADNGIFSQNEVADECESQSGGSEFAWLSLNAPYASLGINTPTVTCQQFMPEAHAPMAATFEFGGMGTMPLVLVYVDPNGHVQSVSWPNAGQAATGPFDLGQPSPSVRAAGKPTIMYSMSAGGELIFVKGSDGAVWMRRAGTWSSLGGQIYGDPSVVSWTWNNALWFHVAAVGLDDKLYVQGVNNQGTAFGWGQVDLDGTLFIGPPNIVSRAANSLDVFVTGEDGQIRWIKFNNPNWSGPTTIPHSPSDPFVSKPAVARTNTTGLELIVASGVEANVPGLWQTSWDGSFWTTFGLGKFGIPTDDYMWGHQGTPAVVSGTGRRVDVFSVARSGKLWWFWSDNEPHGSSRWHTSTAPLNSLNPPPLVSSGVSGDPVAMSRTTGQMEVFYRTNNGRLTHMTTTNSGSSWTTETLLPVNSIQ